MREAAGNVNGRPGEWAGEVIPSRELAALLARFGMIVGLDTSPEADEEFQSAQLAHALVGAAEAHATPRRAGPTGTPERPRRTSPKPP